MVLSVDDNDGWRNALAENLRDDGQAVTDYANPADVPPFMARIPCRRTDEK